MSATPRSPTLTEFEEIITEKSLNFVGREFVFTAITNFLHRHNRGYFTIVGAPGSGKSAILAKYVTENPQVIYYSAEVEGKNRAEEFLRDIYRQLMQVLQKLTSTPPQPSPPAGREIDLSLLTVGLRGIPDNATEGSWFLSLLLQKISDWLEPDQRFIIAIVGCDAVGGSLCDHRIDRNSQPPGSNIFYLPRYLPENVYFLLTRRPFLREKSGLLIEAPSQTLDLGEYPEQNRQDVKAYIQQYLTPLPP